MSNGTLSRMRPRVLLGILVLLASFLVAPAPFPGPEQAAAAPVQTNKVEMKGFAFVPPSIVILKSVEVTWTNQDGTAEAGYHSVTPDAPSNDFEEKPIVFPREFGAPANVVSENFTKTGVYTYFCEFHPGTMRGTVTVVSSFDSPTVNISAEDDGAGENSFSPETIQINKTQTLVWVNRGENHHNVVFENDTIGVVGELNETGNTVNHTFNATGNFRYRCEYHSLVDFETGMVGKVVVGGNNSTHFAPKVKITKPLRGANVTGTLTVEGTATVGLGGTDVSLVELRFDASGAWVRATYFDGLFAYDWNTRNHTDGSLSVSARAKDGELVSNVDTLDVAVKNQGPGSGGNATNTTAPAAKKGPLPGFEAPVLVVAIATLILIARRRRA